MQKSRGSLEQMRWSALFLVIAMMATAEGHTRGAKRAKQIVKKRPVTTAITKAAPQADQPTKKPADPAAPSPTEFTNDPVVGLSTRVDGKNMRGIVAFTFDDGPHPTTTPAVLDALAKYDIPATFFIVTKRFRGRDRDKARELLARELAEGHMIGSHTVGHVRLRKATTKLLDAQLDASFKSLSTEAKIPIAMFRAPYGSIGGAGRTRLKHLGVTEVFWSIDTRDWEATEAAKLRKQVMAMITKQDGGVVLMHDVKPLTAQVIGGVLDDLEAENCRRLAAKEEPIWPVTLHHFLRDGETPRAVPDAVQKKLDAYKAALPGRCETRAAAAAPISPAIPTPATK